MLMTCGARLDSVPVAGLYLKDKIMMNIEKQRAAAQKLCIEAGIAVLPYGNAWWLLGDNVNRVVGELAGLLLSDLHRHQQSAPREAARA